MIKLYSGIISLNPGRTNRKTYLQQQFYPKSENLIKYSKDRIFIGWDSPNKDDKIYIDTHDSEIILIAGMRGAGKSRLLRSLSEELYLSNNKIVFQSDIKNETPSSINPAVINDDKDKKYFRTGEVPQGLSVKSYQPLFLIEDETPDFNCVPFQIGFKDLNLDDLLTIFGVNEEHDVAKAEVIKTLYKEIEDGVINNIDEFMSFIEDTDLIHKASKNGYIMALKNLINYRVIGEEFPINIVDDMLAGNIVTLNLKGYTRFLKARYHTLYISFMSRAIGAACMTNAFKSKVYFFIDEASKICPANGSNTAKTALLYTIDVSRSWSVSMIFATQEIHDLPDKVFQQARYVFVPHTMLWEDFSKLLKRLGMAGWHPAMGDKYRRQLKECREFRDGNRNWIIIDKRKSKLTTFVPKNPVSEHMTEFN